MSTKKIAFGPIFLEAFFVVLGVVLALAANEWRQDRAEDRRTTMAVESLKEEILLNQEMLRNSVDYHIALGDTLRRLGMRNRELGINESPTIQTFDRGFIHPTDLVTTSWSLTLSTDALSNMSYENALAFSRIYALYEAYDEQKAAVGDLFYVDLYEGGYQKVLDNYQNLSIIIGTFTFKECELLQTVESTITEIGSLSLEELPSAPQFCSYLSR